MILMQKGRQNRQKLQKTTIFWLKIALNLKNWFFGNFT